MTLVVDQRDAPPSNVDGQSLSIMLWTTQSHRAGGSLRPVWRLPITTASVSESRAAVHA